MVRADVVLGLRQVHARLAAVRGVHLGHERGGHVHDRHAALVGRGAEAREIADDAPAQRDQMVSSGDAGRDQRLPHGFRAGEGLLLLPGRDCDHSGQLPQVLAVQWRDPLIAHAERARARALEPRGGSDLLGARRSQEPATDQDWVLARVARRPQQARAQGGAR